MLIYSVFFLVLAGSVRASVVINVFEDGEIKASQSQYDGCDFRACDQLCRRLGFPGGVCVGDRCKCDNFKPSPVSKHVIELPFVAVENNSDEENYYEVKRKDHSEAEQCDVIRCNEMCHRLNYIGGMCRDGNCECY